MENVGLDLVKKPHVPKNCHPEAVWEEVLGAVSAAESGRSYHLSRHRAAQHSYLEFAARRLGYRIGGGGTRC